MTVRRIVLFIVLPILLIAGITGGLVHHYLITREPEFERLFHAKKPFEMTRALEEHVTRHPHDVTAWSIYGWHLGINLASYDPVRQAYYRQAATRIYAQAIVANPRDPMLRFDLAWFYMMYEGDYRRAMILLEPLVKTPDRFVPTKPAAWVKEEDKEKWDAKATINRLAYAYKKIGVVTGDWQYIERAIDLYRFQLQLDPKAVTAKRNLKDLQGNLHKKSWLIEQQKKEEKIRKALGMPALHMGDSLEKLFPDATTGIEGIP